jgi:hypothetical protein
MRVLQVIQALNSLVSEDTSNANAKEIVALMYDTAMLTSGFDVESPKDYANKVYDMMGMALSGEIEAPAPLATGAPHQVFCWANTALRKLLHRPACLNTSQFTRAIQHRWATFLLYMQGDWKAWDVVLEFLFIHDEGATRMLLDVLGWHAGSKPKAEPKKKETVH